MVPRFPARNVPKSIGNTLCFVPSDAEQAELLRPGRFPMEQRRERHVELCAKTKGKEVDKFKSCLVVLDRQVEAHTQKSWQSGLHSRIVEP